MEGILNRRERDSFEADALLIVDSDDTDVTEEQVRAWDDLDLLFWPARLFHVEHSGLF